jgi:GT2 family glycosyltransferase
MLPLQDCTEDFSEFSGPHGKMGTMANSSPNVMLSVVIVTWNGKQFTLECLESLWTFAQGLSVEIIVLDNNSTDGTPAEIRARFPEVRLVCNDANLGFAKANNIGIALSRGKYLCLINSDVVVPAGCLEKMVSYLEAHSDVGLLGPKMVGPDGSTGYAVMRLPNVWNSLCCALGLHSILPKSKWFGGFQLNGYPYDSVDDVEVLTGWFWMLPRRALSMVGGLDERFFMYGEDIDWCYRFRAAGWRVVFFPEAQALHYGAASSGKTPTRFYIEMQRANLQYFRKHHGVLGWLGYYLVSWIHQLVRVVGYSLAYVFGLAERSKCSGNIRRSCSCLVWLAGLTAARGSGDRLSHTEGCAGGA